MIKTVFYKSTIPKVSIWWKINPIWWFGNMLEPHPPYDYKPNDHLWLRYIKWYLRNPLMNFYTYVLGVCDKDHWVTGKVPVMTAQRNDLGEWGWQYSVIWFWNIPLLPFVSYAGPKVRFYLGWQPWGRLGFKFNLSSAFQLW